MLRCCKSIIIDSTTLPGTAFCANCGKKVPEENIYFKRLERRFIKKQEEECLSKIGRFQHAHYYSQQDDMVKGHAKITELAELLVDIPTPHRDLAKRYYNLAVIYRFTKDNPSDQVAAVCLYAVSIYSHMLIDFADILHISVFTLSATFSNLLSQVLNFDLPHIDPSLYIHRFAKALKLTEIIAQDAIKIVQHMDREWITNGSKPASVCGACLVVAAQANNLKVTVGQVVDVIMVINIAISQYSAEPIEQEITKDIESWLGIAETVVKQTQWFRDKEHITIKIEEQVFPDTVDSKIPNTTEETKLPVKREKYFLRKRTRTSIDTLTEVLQQLMIKKIIPEEIHLPAFDETFETPESIAKIKEKYDNLHKLDKSDEINVIDIEG